MASFADICGMKQDMAVKFGRAFGAGMGLGLTCGAVTGAFIVLGCSLGDVEKDDRKARYASYGLAKDFRSRFEARRRTISCKELLGVDLGSPEGYKEAKDRGLFGTVCSGLVQDAAEILDEMIRPGVSPNG
ncbi:MAG: C-GCAxxG-C-C family protein [Pseudomonadota bacterium]